MAKRYTPCEYMKLPPEKKEKVKMAERLAGILSDVIEIGVEQKIAIIFGPQENYHQLLDTLIEKKQGIDLESKVNTLREYLTNIDRVRKELTDKIFSD